MLVTNGTATATPPKPPIVAVATKSRRRLQSTFPSLLMLFSLKITKNVAEFTQVFYCNKSPSEIKAFAPFIARTEQKNIMITNR
jgi:hypothetical protein